MEFRETTAAEVSAMSVLLVTVPCVACGQREGWGQLECHLSLDQMLIYDTAVVTPNVKLENLM